MDAAKDKTADRVLCPEHSCVKNLAPSVENFQNPGELLQKHTWKGEGEAPGRLTRKTGLCLLDYSLFII